MLGSPARPPGKPELLLVPLGRGGFFQFAGGYSPRPPLTCCFQTPQAPFSSGLSLTRLLPAQGRGKPPRSGSGAAGRRALPPPAPGAAASPAGPSGDRGGWRGGAGAQEVTRRGGEAAAAAAAAWQRGGREPAPIPASVPEPGPQVRGAGPGRAVLLGGAASAAGPAAPGALLAPGVSAGAARPWRGSREGPPGSHGQRDTREGTRSPCGR